MNPNESEQPQLSQQPPGDDQPTTYFPPSPAPALGPAPDYSSWGQGYGDFGGYEPYMYGPQPMSQELYPEAAHSGGAQLDATYADASGVSPARRSNGLLVFLGVLVFGLAIFSAAAALYIFGQRAQDQYVAEPAGKEREAGPEVDRPATEFGQRLEDLGRPTVAQLPAEAQPVNVAAKQNHPAGNLFNVYKSGPVSDDFAVETQYEYVSLYSEPPTGDHLLLVFDAVAEDYVELHCQDYSSYVRCVAPGNRYVYIA